MCNMLHLARIRSDTSVQIHSFPTSSSYYTHVKMSSPGNSLSSFIDDKMDDRMDTINSIFSNHQTPNLNLNFHLPSDLLSGLIDPDTLVYRGTIAIGICVPLLVGLFMCRVYARGVVERVWEVEDCMTSPNYLLPTTC